MKKELGILAKRVAPASLTERVQRRLHERVITAVILTLTRGALTDALTLGPRPQVVLALTEEQLWILGHRWPNAIDGILDHFQRTDTRLHTRRQTISRHHKIELSWPTDHGFIAGTIPSGPASDLLIGHLTADELLER